MNGVYMCASPNWYCSRVTDSCQKHGKSYILFGGRHSLYVLRTDTQPAQYVTCIASAHDDRMTSVAACKHDDTDNLCATASDDGNIKVWKLDEKKPVFQHDIHKGKPTVVDWSLANKNLIVSSDDKGYLVWWNIATGEQKNYSLDPGHIFSLACCPHEEKQVAVGYRSGIVLVVMLHKKAQLLQKLKGHDDEVQGLCWSPVLGDACLPASKHREHQDLDAPTQDEQEEEQKEAVLLASSGKDRTVRVWNVNTGYQMWMQRVGGQRSRQDDGGRVRVWIALCWPRATPEMLVSSAPSGELLLWDLKSKDKQKSTPFSVNAAFKGHKRLVFNICESPGKDGTSLWTISMDRQLCHWNLDVLDCCCTIPTLGGFVYSVTQSPINPGKLAVGVGDAQIRVWNVDSPISSYDCDTFWQGIKAKVTALSWHPSKENWLAYGTEEGRVGVCDVLSERPPLVSSKYHRKTVYVVAWGPQYNKKSEDEKSKTVYDIYSCGDGDIWCHDPYKFDTRGVSLNQIIAKVSDIQGKLPGRSEISWKMDFSAVALGNEDGTVDILSRHMKLLCKIQIQRKLVNAVRWHPEFTAASEKRSALHCWLAVGSNESTIHVVNLTQVLDGERTEMDEPFVITDSVQQLEGHGHRITGLSWSIHQEGMLASASYDGSAQIWNAKDGTAIANFRGHSGGRLFCVQWSLLDPDVVYSGGDDLTLQVWRVSQQEHKTPPRGEEKKFKKAKKHKSEKPKEPAELTDKPEGGLPLKVASPKPAGAAAASLDAADMTEIQRLLEEKRKELQASSGSKPVISMEDQQKASQVQINLEKEATPVKVGTSLSPNGAPVGRSTVSDADHGQGYNLDGASHNKNSATTRHRRKQRSLLPVSATKENQLKEANQQDCLRLAQFLAENAEIPENFSHLGLFGTRRDLHKLISMEVANHRQNGSWEQELVLEVWKGNLSAALTAAAERGHLCDWHMALAPAASNSFLTSLCDKYVKQLAREGSFHKASTFYLAVHKLQEAISMLKANGLYREAITLAKLRLAPSDPLLQDLYTGWANYMDEIGDTNLELAAKCFLAVGQVEEAVHALCRRNNAGALAIAAELAFINQKEELARDCGLRFVQECQAASNWQPLFDFLLKHLDQFMPHYCETTVFQHLIVEMNNKETNTERSLDGTLILGSSRNGNNTENQIKKWKSDGFSDTAHNMEKLCQQLLKILQTRQKGTATRQVIIYVSCSICLYILKKQLGQHKESTKYVEQAMTFCVQAQAEEVLQAMCRFLKPLGPEEFLSHQECISEEDDILHRNINICYNWALLKYVQKIVSNNENVGSNPISEISEFQVSTSPAQATTNDNIDISTGEQNEDKTETDSGSTLSNQCVHGHITLEDLKTICIKLHLNKPPVSDDNQTLIKSPGPSDNQAQSLDSAADTNDECNSENTNGTTADSQNETGDILYSIKGAIEKVSGLIVKPKMEHTPENPVNESDCLKSVETVWETLQKPGGDCTFSAWLQQCVT